jgi:hypothetical protein
MRLLTTSATVTIALVVVGFTNFQPVSAQADPVACLQEFLDKSEPPGPAEPVDHHFAEEWAKYMSRTALTQFCATIDSIVATTKYVESTTGTGGVRQRMSNKPQPNEQAEPATPYDERRNLLVSIFGKQAVTVVCDPRTHNDVCCAPKDPGWTTGGNYDTVVATLKGFGLLPDEQGYTDTNAMAGATLAYFATHAASTAAQFVCDALHTGDPISAAATATCIAVQAVTIIADYAAEIVLMQGDFQDAATTATLLSANHDRVETVLENQCAMYDEVICRQVVQLGRGHGCNGLDDDCDRDVDECDEDIVSPTIDTTAARTQC